MSHHRLRLIPMRYLVPLLVLLACGCQSLSETRLEFGAVVLEADLLVEDLKAAGVLKGEDYDEARRVVDIAKDAMEAWKEVEEAGADLEDRRAAYAKARVAIREALVLIAKYRRVAVPA